MRKVKARELSGLALDYAVCLALGHTRIGYMNGQCRSCDPNDANPGEYYRRNYSSDWRDAGEIIAREKICTEFDPKSETWLSYIQMYIAESDNTYHDFGMRGSTPLESAMRCFVLAALGSEVEVPE